MARTTNYIFDCADLAFVRDFVRKQIAQANGLTDTGLITAVDDMDTALQRLDSQLLSQDSAVQIFADSLRLFDAHDDFHGIVGKLRNGLRVRNYRRKNGSRKASQKTITISHEALGGAENHG